MPPRASVTAVACPIPLLVPVTNAMAMNISQTVEVCLVANPIRLNFHRAIFIPQRGWLGRPSTRLNPQTSPLPCLLWVQIRAGRPWFGTGFHGSHSSRTPAFGGCSSLRDGRAETHSAVQRIPRSHSSASLRSRSALALSCSARASLRYRIARALLMASQIPTQQNEDSNTGKKIWFGAVRWHAVRQKG